MIKLNLEKLQDLTDKLNEINAALQCPVLSEKLRLQQLSLQYDYFMEFIGTYEDTVSAVNQLENELEAKRYKKQLEQFWRDYEIATITN